MPDSSEPRTPFADRGRHKIFLGYAGGVGKTYALLEEARRRKGRGQDVVIAWLGKESRPNTQALTEGLEVVPPTSNGELDLEAVLQRAPEVAVIDELAHRNAPGSANVERWQDVETLTKAGINVLSTLNVYQLESLNDDVFDITGQRITVTVPDHVFHDAVEVELCDLTPRALVNRIDRGDVVPQEETAAAKDGFYRFGNLFALRERALREIAGRVDEDLEEYRREKNIERPWAANDRIMICIGASRSSLRLLRRGWRNAKRHHGEVVAVYVEDHRLDDNEQRILQDDFRLAERLRVPVVRLKGNVAQELIKYAQDHNITQLVLGHSERSKLQELTKSSLLSELARHLRNIDFYVVASDKQSGH